jgi:hypothetical protein
LAALKILRGMYERAVTSVYLFENPEEADRFLDYDKVHKYRAYNHAKNLREFAPSLPPTEVQRIKDDYDAVKSLYSEEICKPCQKTRIMGSWTKLDTASMAHKTGKGYADLYYNAFYRPTLEVHTTVSSIHRRLSRTSDGLMSFKAEAQRVEARHAVLMAHHLLIGVLLEQNKRFSLGLDGEVTAVINEFKRLYPAPSTTT